jgi:hypothetical protein
VNSCSQLVNLCPFKPRSSYIIGLIKNMIWRGYYALSHKGKGVGGCQHRWTHKSSLQGGFRRRGRFCVYLIFPILSLLSQQDRKLRLWWWWHYRLFLAVLCRRKRELAAVMVYRPRSMGWERKKSWYSKCIPLFNRIARHQCGISDITCCNIHAKKTLSIFFWAKRLGHRCFREPFQYRLRDRTCPGSVR